MLIDIMQKRINEIKQQDRKSYYEIANEIGISESTLYKLMSKGELFTPAEQKITAYLKGYLTKDEKLEAYRLDNEELKAKNDRLNRCLLEALHHEGEKIRETIKYKSCLQEIKEIAEKLMADNLCNNCDGIGLDANCQDTGCPYYQMDKILQKITKAEEE